MVRGASAPSPFLDHPVSERIASNDLAFAIRDAFPVAPGLTLVGPSLQCASWSGATREEQAATCALAQEVERAGSRGPVGIAQTEPRQRSRDAELPGNKARTSSGSGSRREPLSYLAHPLAILHRTAR